MMKALAFFLLAHAICGTMNMFAEGGGGISVTTLTQGISATATAAEVKSTVGYLKKDYIVIGDEFIAYLDTDADTFKNMTRGWNNTTAKAHAAGTKVYSSNADVINAALGFNIMSTGDTVGNVDIWDAGVRFFSTTVARFVTWDYGILKVGAMNYVRAVLSILGGAFLVYLGLTFVGSFGRKA